MVQFLILLKLAPKLILVRSWCLLRKNSVLKLILKSRILTKIGPFSKIKQRSNVSMSTVLSSRRGYFEPLIQGHCVLRALIGKDLLFILPHPWCPYPDKFLIVFFGNQRSFAFPSHGIKRTWSESWGGSGVLRSKLGRHFVVPRACGILKELWFKKLSLLKPARLEQFLIHKKTSKRLPVRIVLSNRPFGLIRIIRSLKCNSLHGLRFLSSVERLDAPCAGFPLGKLLLNGGRVS